jgi:hypothetical protein
MFALIAILVITGITIEVMESIGESYENIALAPSFLIPLLHAITAIHVLSGLSFAILSIIHIKINWKTLKTHFNKKAIHINQEAILALLLTTTIITIGTILSFIVFGE